MATQDCVRCHNALPVGSEKCPYCGLEHPHRSRPVRAAAMARRRLVVIGCVVLAVLVYLALSFVQTGGEKERSSACKALDAEQAKFDQAAASGQEVTQDMIAQLERLRVACEGSQH